MTNLADEAPPKRKPRHSREHTFQAWANRFIDKVVRPPFFVTGIDHASQITDNARARMAGRGIKFGLPDMFVAQLDEGSWRPRSVWIELKRGTQLSAAQEGVHKALRSAGQRVYVARNMQDILHGLRDTGFRLHGNADNISTEYEARLDAADRAAPAKLAKRAKNAGRSRPRRAPTRGRDTWAATAGRENFVNVIKVERYQPSNGTEGEIFQAQWCERCQKDRFESKPCGILGRTMAYEVNDRRYPKEWVRNRWHRVAR